MNPMNQMLPYLLVFIVGAVCGYILGGCTTSSYYKLNAINHNFAHYNSTNGDWEWNAK